MPRKYIDLSPEVRVATERMAERDRLWKEAFDRVLARFHPVVFNELDKGYSPTLKVICLLIKKWDERDQIPLQSTQSTEGQVFVWPDAPAWVGQAAIEAQCLPTKGGRDTSESLYESIATWLKYNHLFYLKKKNGLRHINIDEVLATVEKISAAGVRKRRLRIAKMNLGVPNRDYFLLFEVDSLEVQKALMLAAGLTRIVK